MGALTSKDFRFAMRAWELTATPSVCTGCATGCNIEIHASRDKVYRLVPRENPEVNKHWMCDEGRFTYKPLHGARLAVPMVAGAPVEWDQRARRGRPAAEGAGSEGGNLGVVFSAQATNEDLHVLARLASEGLKAKQVYLSGLDEGWSDDILVSADKNPNTAGAKAIGRRRRQDAWSISSSDLKAGALGGLLVLGDAACWAATSAPRWRRCRCRKLDTLVLLATHQGPAGGRRPRGAAAVDVGRGRRHHHQPPGAGAAAARRASRPAGDSLPGWDILVAPRPAAGHDAGSRYRQEGVPRRQGRPRLHEGRRVGPALSCRCNCGSPTPAADGRHNPWTPSSNRSATASSASGSLAAVIKVVLLMLVLGPGIASILTWLERRQSSMMQDRLGPNRANICPAAG